MPEEIRSSQLVHEMAGQPHLANDAQRVPQSASPRGNQTPNRASDQFQVKTNGSISDVPAVPHHPSAMLRDRPSVSILQIRKSNHAGLHQHPTLVAHQQLGKQFVGARLFRTWTNQEHVSTKHIPQLGQARPGEVRRRKDPVGTTRVSSTSANTGPDWLVMVRIFKIRKVDPSRPTRSCRKKNGPGTPRASQTTRMLNNMNAAGIRRTAARIRCTPSGRP